MVSKLDGRFCGEIAIVAGLVGIHVIYGTYMLFLHRVLALGFEPLFLVVAGSLTSAVFLLPLAILFERKKWPERLQAVTVAQFVLIALGRHEKFDIRCNYTRTKIMGALMCLCGALVMSFLQPPSTSSSATSQALSTRWILGCCYLLMAVVVFSCATVLQAVTMRIFRAPFTLCVITFGLGSVLTALVEIIIEGRLGVGSSNFSLKSIVGIVLAGSLVVMVCLTYQTWCINKKGPVFVSMFSPIQTIFCSVVSAMILGQTITLTSLAGLFIMFSGLYIVLWAKKKEEPNSINADGSVSALIGNFEKPLLR